MRTLVSYLNERPPQDLRNIAENWQASLTDRLYTGNTFQLSQEMTSEFLQRRLLEKLAKPELDLLRHFIGLPGFVTSLRELATTQTPQTSDEAQLDHLTTSLRQSGLLFEDKVRAEPDDPDGKVETPKARPGWGEIYGWRGRNVPTVALKEVLVLPRELARPLSRLLAEKEADQVGRKPTLSHQPLAQLLKRLEPEVLEAQAENWGILALLGSNVSPAAISSELTRALADKAQQKRVLSELPEGSQELFEQLRAQGGRTTLPALLAEYVSLKRLGRNLRPLTERLLAWEAFEGGESIVFVPSEIANPQSESQPSALPLQTVTAPPDVSTFPPYALAWDSLTYLTYLSQNEVELTARNYIPKRDLKKLAAQMWVKQEVEESYRLTFLINLCFSLKLYEADEESGRVVGGLGLPNWLELDFYEQSRQFCATWLQDALHTGPVTFPPHYNTRHVINGANRAMLNLLTDCVPGHWYSLATFLHKIQRDNPYFILPRRDLLNLVGQQRLEELGRMWMYHEGDLLQQTLSTALNWLGIVQIGRDEAGRPIAFSVTPFGAEMCEHSGATRQALPPTPNPILVQPSFEVMLLAPDVETIWTLQKFTNVHKLDRVSLFALGRESVLRGLESGLTSTDIIEWLQSQNSQPLPQNIVTSIEDWSKSFRRLVVAPVMLLEAEDPLMLDELIQSPQYAAFFVRRLSPTAALVNLPTTSESRRSNPLKSFKSKLKAGGYYAQ